LATGRAIHPPPASARGGPTGNPDAKSADGVFELMRQVDSDSGTRVNHNPGLACRFHRIIEVADGRIRPEPPPPPSSRHKFSGDINGLKRRRSPLGRPFLLASIARFLYPVGCASHASGPGRVLAGRMIRKSGRRFSEQVLLVSK